MNIVFCDYLFYNFPHLLHLTLKSILLDTWTSKSWYSLQFDVSVSDLITVTKFVSFHIKEYLHPTVIGICVFAGCI